MKVKDKAKKPKNDDDVPIEHEEGRFSNFPIREKTIAKLHGKKLAWILSSSSVNHVLSL